MTKCFHYNWLVLIIIFQDILGCTHHNWPVAGVDISFKAESEEEHCSSDARANLRLMVIVTSRVGRVEMKIMVMRMTVSVYEPLIRLLFFCFSVRRVRMRIQP